MKPKREKRSRAAFDTYLQRGATIRTPQQAMTALWTIGELARDGKEVGELSIPALVQYRLTRALRDYLDKQ